MRSVAKSRFLHFLVLGGAIFALAPKSEEPRRIELRSQAFATLDAAEAKRRSLASIDSDKEREVRARAIEDEVLYREAVRLGLDRDDPIVRQRLAQKLLLLEEDLGGASQAPTDVELRAFFEQDRARWRRPARTRFVHVFATRRDSLPDDRALAPWAESGVPRAGEPFPYARDITGTREDLARVYGPEFADAVSARAIGGAFSEPVQSSFGWHRVRVVEREPGRLPTFEEARAEIALDYMLARRERIVGAYMKKTVGEYRITVDGEELRDFTPTRRVAVRNEPSAED
jgi:hypothetical protein